MSRHLDVCAITAVRSTSGLGGVDIPENIRIPGEKSSLKIMKDVFESSDEKTWGGKIVDFEYEGSADLRP